MHATLFSVAVAAPLMVLASASPREFQFPDSVPLNKRQTSGPKFECHSACGNAILQSRDSSDYCDSTEWVGLLDDCLDCALEFEIWQYYSPEVKPAAEACGLNATPKPAGGDTTTSAAAQTTTQAAETQPASTAEPVTTGASTEAGHTAAPTTDAEHGHATAVHTTLSTAEAKPEATTPAGHESHKPSGSVSPAPENTPVVAGASALGLSGLAVAAGAAVAVMVNLQ
ncbi:hypothetical protein NLU13_9559 [Sarocladium strictum]|uniref:Uncharacterized protein n=1 Tax=Sarocladium strictum TaxID=5046 RepID=A0AA39GAB7_SARSR|nr:hypothetical protein NLU13_9559 [Sarocladium strictum]